MTNEVLSSVSKRPVGAFARLASLVVSMVAIAGFADDLPELVVDEGQEVTLSTSGTYRKITVNGTLIVDSGAVVTLDYPTQYHQAYLYVGMGVGKTGKLIVRNGAKITAPECDGPYFYFGKDGGRAEVEIDNASIYCWKLFLADGLTTGKPSSANVVLKNNANVYAQNALFLSSKAEEQGECETDNENAAVNVTLESGSLLKTWWFQKFNGVRNDLHFRGGHVQTQCMLLYGAGDLVMDGTPDWPISLVLPSSSDGNGGFWDGISYFFNLKPWDISAGRVRFIGNCDLEKRGSGASDQVLALANGAERLSFEHTGATHVMQGGFGLAANVTLPASGALLLDANCKIDLRGKELEVGALLGAGEIVDTAADAGTLRFTVPEGVTAACAGGLSPRVKLAKSGLGTLEIVSDAAGGIKVDEGTLKLLNRGDVGYSQYRFKVDSAYGDTFDGMHIAELVFYNGDTDVTKPIQALAHAPGNTATLFDGVVDNDNNKWWFTCHYANQPDFTEAYVDVLYAGRKPIDSYTWWSARDTAPGNANCRDPGSWRVLGRDAGGEWRELSRVGFREYTLQERTRESKKFDLVYSGEVCGGAVSIAKGATLALADGVTLACSTYDCRGQLVIGDDAKLVVGDDSDTTIAYPNFTGNVSFEKTGNGTVKLLGPVAGVGALVVSGGTLKPMVGCDAPWLSYKFVLEANAGNCDFQFGEIALYDRTGERVNLLANLSSYSVEGNDGYKLLDGDLASCNWKDKAPLTAALTLKAADSVAGYLYAPTSQYDNWRKAPSQWKVYARRSAEDDWTLLDERAEACDQAYDKTWLGYNKGNPYFFTVVRDTTKTAFDPSVVVTVKAGATLDLTGTATTLAALKVDAASPGTVKGGALAAEGTLDVVASEGLRGEVELPLTLDGTQLPANLSGWTLTVNGMPTKYRLAMQAGKLVLQPSGMLIFVK